MLSGQAIRIQYSVFYAMLQPSEFTELQKKIRSLIQKQKFDPDTDSICFIPACQFCLQTVSFYGRDKRPSDKFMIF